MQDMWQQDMTLEARAGDTSASGVPGFGSSPMPGIPRQHRRLPERILVAAHQACDLGELQTAGSLLSILEVVLLQPTAGSLTAQRRTIEGMVAAYERLWHLRRGTTSALS